MLLSSFLNRLAIAAQTVESGVEDRFEPEVIEILDKIRAITGLYDNINGIDLSEPEVIRKNSSSPISFLSADFFDDRYLQILESLADSIIILSLEGRIEYVTKVTLELFEIDDINDIVGDHIMDWILPAYRPIVMANFKTALIDRQTSHAKAYPIQNKKGKMFWTEINSSIIIDNNNNPIKVVSVIRDVSEREAQKDELFKTDSNIKTIIENIQEMIWSVDKNFNLLFFNSNVYNFFKDKFSIQLKIGDSAVRPFMEALLKNSKEIYSKSLSGINVSEKQEFFIQEKPYFREISANPIRSQDGSIIAVAMVATDVTDKALFENIILRNSANISAILNNTHDAIWSFDPFYKLTVSNVAAKEFFNKSFNVDIDNNFNLKDLNFQGQEDWTTQFERALEGDSFIFKTSLSNQLSTTYFEHRFQSIIDSEGNVSGVTVFTRNITDKILWEKELILNELRLKNLLKLSSLIREDVLHVLAIALADCAYAFDSYAAFFTTIFDGKIDATYFSLSLNVIPTPGLNKAAQLDVKFQNILQEVLKSDTAISLDFEYGDEELSIDIYKPERLLCVPIIDNDKTVALITIINKNNEYDNIDSRQLTLYAYEVWKFFETKKIEDKLAQEHRQLISIFDSIPENIYVSDLNTNEILFVNKHIQSIYGEDLIGKSASQVFTDVQTFIEMSDDSKATVARREIYNSTLDKHYININRIINWPDGREVNFDLSIDVTKEFNATLELEESEIKLRELNATKDKFFSIIAHDLKNPFGAILNYSMELIEKNDILSEATKKEFIHEIHDSASAIYKLLDNLLLWARTQTGRIKFAPEFIDLGETSFDAVYVYKSAAEEKNIQLINNIPTNTIVKADYNMLQTVFRNLLSNAIKFTPHSGRVSIDYSIENNLKYKFYKISVSDTGSGIPSSELDNLFKIDYTGEMFSNVKEKGAGLGLILCREFIERHGGSIYVDSNPNMGSKFVFTLPVIEENDN